MKVKNASLSELQQALALTNIKYQNNITFKRLDYPTFTLTVNSTLDNKPGYRISNTGRKISAACWHAHGDFFDSLFSINPSAIITVSDTPKPRKITKDSGNWQDRNIGSLFNPLMFSDACRCKEDN